MVPHKRRGVEGEQGTVNDENKRYPEVVHRLAERDALLVHVHDELGYRDADEVYAKQRCRAHEREEIAVVAPADTVVQPHAVMVLSFDTVVAEPAMVCSRGAPYVARFAEFGWHLHRGSRPFRRLDESPVISWRSEPERILVPVSGRKVMQVPRQYLEKRVSIISYLSYMRKGGSAYARIRARGMQE